MPDTDAVRQRALQASWQRDRWVVRRRVALRWVTWAIGRYVVPAVLAFGAIAAAWIGLLQPQAPTEPPLQLRLNTVLELPALQPVASPPKLDTSVSDNFPSPQLAPDIGLHRQEP